MNVSDGTYVNHGVDADDATAPTGRTTYEDTTTAPRPDSDTGVADAGGGYGDGGRPSDTDGCGHG
ncbi:hypothetical protein ACWCQ1_31510 [Streptomyces sp. NPDC002144]|uniref:hypothetical protein n=1 Tax=Streptomyces sp. NPDC006668 TaxID=3156903 RepID=UPI003403AAD8